MKTIVIVGSKDTKESEITYVSEGILKRGFKPLVLDVSTSKGYESQADFTREQIALEGGTDWKDTEDYEKHELLLVMSDGLKVLTTKLYKEGKLHGIIALGGLQNTTMGSSAMFHLPIGIPKLIVSTVATGQRTFEGVVGSKDITVMPSPSDFTGVNSISKTVLNNAIAAILGMVEYAGKEISKSKELRIGATLMGATNDGIASAIEILQQKGYEVVSFHSTGTGGRVMEELIEADVINAVMDLTLHEVVYEYFGYGFGYGADNRLVQGAKKGIPMLICPAGVDFMCQWPSALFNDIDQRKYNWHNPNLAHVKLNQKEVTDISRMIVQRLNEAKGKVVVVIPTKGLRSFSQQGEALYDPEVDQAITDVFVKELRHDIPIKFIDANLMDIEFSKFVVKEMIKLLNI
ncbi:MAG: Tm-1-like ATP-binding domain-containing protein [Eubacteriales bacterium]